MAGHRISIAPSKRVVAKGSVKKRTEDDWTYYCIVGTNYVLIRNSELIVDWHNYGRLDDGDPISIEDGRVFVAGEIRSAPEMTRDEILAYSCAEERFFDLEGREIRFIPGSPFAKKTTSISGKKSILYVGEHQVEFKDDQLFVNGVSYGSSSPGDVFLVEFGAVRKLGDAFPHLRF